MTTTLSPIELSAVNQGRVERGLPPLGSSVQATAVPFLQTITAQDFAPPPGGERKFEISIRDVSVIPPAPPGVGTPQPQPPTQQPRYTQPSEPPPSSFAAEVNAVIASRLGHRLYKRQSLPKDEQEPEDPSTFAGQVAIAIKRRKKGYANPKPWSQPN